MNVAFYSYKGGVGRTQLVANLARYLYLYENKKVLLMDWDLEAPGLHYYFKKTNEDFKGEGLIDLLEKYVQLVKNNNPAEITEAQLPKFEAVHITPTECLNETTGARIDIIAAGAYADFPTYRQKIIDFNWNEFYKFLDGARYLEYTIKPNLKDLGYDFVFIDSRTGISDYQNICNIQLVDANVIVIAPNMQNLEGCMEVAKSIVESPYVKEGNRKPIVFPILSRVDVYAEDYPVFENMYKQKCQFLIDNLNELHKNNDAFIPFRIDINEYVKNTRLPYNIRIAIGENQLFNENHNPLLLGEFHQQFQNIANYLLQPSKKVAIIYILKDSATANWLSTSLKKLGINVLADTNSVPSGVKMEDFMNEITKQADVIMPILSEDCLTSTQFLHEFAHFSADPQKKIILFYSSLDVLNNIQGDMFSENLIENSKNKLLKAREKALETLNLQDLESINLDEFMKEISINQKFLILPQILARLNKENTVLLDNNISENLIKIVKSIKETT